MFQRAAASDALTAPEAMGAIEATLVGERRRLVALCARITGDRDAAEDLAQETLIEAWRHWHALRRRDRVSAWLTGIARNVCRRWARARGHELSHLVEPMDTSDGRLSDERDQPDAAIDLEAELERAELLQLLDRALALLPAEARRALIERYARESSISEIAERLGVNAPAAAMRLQRSKLALRQILTTTLREEIAPYVIGVADSGWQETRIWCFVCGRRHLRGRITADSTLILTCPDCFPDPRHALFDTCPEIWGPVKGYGRALARTLDWMGLYYQSALDSRTMPCYVCGASLPLGALTRLPAPTWNDRWALGFHHRCPRCHAESSQPLSGLLLASPEGRRFQREHPRMRIAPEQETMVDGRPAVLTRFVSLTDQASLEVISARDSGQVARVIYGSR